MSNAPPTYDTAVNSHSTTAAAPQVAVTDAAGHQVSQPSTTSSGNNSRNNRTRTEEDDSSDSDDDEYGSGFLHPHPAGGFHGDARKSMESMDEEYRELPDGWVRCFDPKTQHAFYAEEKTGRTIWQHPYDDPDFLRSLPDTHPANPNSAEAKAARAKYEEQKKMAAQRGGGEGAGASAQQQQSSASTSSASAIRPPNHEKRHGVKGFTDKILGGNPDERRYKKEKRREQERKQQEAFYARRKALLERQINDPRYQGIYARDPYMYAPPPGSAYMMNSGRYGYGYPRYGYSRGYGYPYGGGWGAGTVGMAGMGLGTGLLLGGLMF